MLDILRLGAYQILFLDKIPVSAAVNEAVEQTKTYANKRAAGLVNGSLRTLARRKDELEKPHDLATKYSHPQPLVDCLRASMDEETLEAFLAADNDIPKTALQCNPLIAAPEQIARDVVAFLAEKLAGRHGVIAVSQSSDNAQENAVTRELIRLARSSLPHVAINADLRFTEHMEKNKQLVMDYMKKTPDLLGAYTTAGAACACWAAAKRALGRDDMIIVGTDYTDETLDLVERGEVQAFVAQPLYEEAQTSVIALDTLLRGNSCPFFTSLDAPLVTRANMDRYRKLLQDVNNWYA